MPATFYLIVCIFRCHPRYLTLISCSRVLCPLIFPLNLFLYPPRAKPRCSTSSWKACSIISKLKTFFCLHSLVWLCSGSLALELRGSPAGAGFVGVVCGREPHTLRGSGGDASLNPGRSWTFKDFQSGISFTTENVANHKCRKYALLEQSAWFIKQIKLSNIHFHCYRRAPVFLRSSVAHAD